MLNKDLIRAAADINVVFKLARHGDLDKIGIHLAKPTERELWDALERCDKDMFETIYIHQVNTFGRVNHG